MKSRNRKLRLIKRLPEIVYTNHFSSVAEDFDGKDLAGK